MERNDAVCAFKEEFLLFADQRFRDEYLVISLHIHENKIVTVTV